MNLSSQPKNITKQSNSNWLHNFVQIKIFSLFQTECMNTPFTLASVCACKFCYWNMRKWQVIFSLLGENQSNINWTELLNNWYFWMSLIDWYPFVCNNFLFRFICFGKSCLWMHHSFGLKSFGVSDFVCAYVRLSRYRPCQSAMCHCTISKEFLWQKNYSFGQLYNGANRSKNLHM